MNALRHPLALFLVFLFALRTVALVTVVATPAVVMSGCGASANEKAAKAAMLTTNSMRDGFIAWDREHQEQILAQHSTESAELQQDAIFAYRTKRNEVTELFVAVYQAILAAYVGGFDEASMKKIVHVGHELREAIDTLKGGH